MTCTRLSTCLALLTLLAPGCPDPDERGAPEPSSGAAATPTKPAATSTKPAATPAKPRLARVTPAPPISTDPRRYGRKLTRKLAGRVTLAMRGGCSGCSGGGLIVRAKVVGKKIFVRADSGCRGLCEAYWPSSGETTLRALPAGAYTIYYRGASLTLRRGGASAGGSAPARRKRLGP